MQFKTFVAVLHGEEYQRVIDVTAMLATSDGCHVVGVHAEPLPVALAAPLGFGDAGFIGQAIEANEQRSAKLKAEFSKRMDAEGISSEWWGFENYSGDSARSAVAMARAADLVVIPQVDPESGSADIADVEALLFESGRPVLIVPYAGPLPRKIRTVLVAWNGSKESARATFDALPFLGKASATEILVVDGNRDADTPGWTGGAEIAAALARHGINTAIRDEPADADTPISAIIENRAAELGADLLVMGAYSHSRLREWLFGGATRTVLRSMPALTLMSR